ncbi:MAG TPA: sulfatase [Sedimentisphaerales bacterium]|nr:sulfatase [Sedimentisphaerales bacterium]
MIQDLTRRSLLKQSAAAMLGTMGGSLKAAGFGDGARPQRRPNIIMFISDDHGIDFVGCYGNKDMQTPNIDAMARDGALFTNMFAASPTCAPSRSVLWTGLYPARNGCMGNHTICRDDITALPTYLRKLGYRVALMHKFHAKPREIFNFEYIEAKLPPRPERHRTYRMEGLDTNVVDEFLAEHAQSRADTPLCLIVADSSPHVVWEPNQNYDPAKIHLPPFIVDTELTRKAMTNYFQDIMTMDKRLGLVRASLKKHGFEKNTLLIYTTDQGAEWPHCKWTVYDTGLHVPFIAVWPGTIKPGSVFQAMISFVDMTPTFIDIAGGQQPDGIDGKSFLNVLSGKAMTFREVIFATHTRDGNMNVFPQRCVRDSRYKYVLNLNPENLWTTHFTKVPGIPESHKEVWDTWVEKARTDPQTAKLVDTIEHHPAEELYDLQADPYELSNIAGKPEVAAILAKMRLQLEDWMISQMNAAMLPSRPIM